tara:strand:- start:291 stop:437 length:147 start_codon:yes stop_codon:yes gene_type:complete
MNLDKMMKEAYKDRAKLEHLRKNHDLQAQKVINRILNDHFNKQLPLFG